MKYYLIRHNSGEYFEVQAWTTARLRKLIETECHDRGWEVDDTETIPMLAGILAARKQERMKHERIHVR